MNPTKQKLIAYFSGALSPDEKRHIEDWLADHPDDALLEECIRTVLENQAHEDSDEIPESTVLAHTRIQEMIGKEQSAKPGPLRRFLISRRRDILRYAAAAAILVIVSVTGLEIYRHNGVSGAAQDRLALAQPKVYDAARATITRITLADGSIVRLFPGSSLIVDTGFSTGDRIVSLNGRGYFEVAHHPDHPFYVRSGRITTRVLGTAFDVNTWQKNETRVVVKEGKVEVAGSGRVLSALTPGQGIFIDKLTGRWKVQPVDFEDYCSWTKGQLGFRQVALRDILPTLGLWFGVSFRIDTPGLADKKLTFFVRRQNRQEAMDVLSAAGDFHYRLTADTIIIK